MKIQYKDKIKEIKEPMKISDIFKEEIEASKYPIIAGIFNNEYVNLDYKVEKDGKVIAASVWGKLKTVTQMLAIILAFIDLNSFGDCFKGTLQGWPLVLNILVTLMMIVQVIATIFSGASYMKNFKELLKD